MWSDEALDELLDKLTESGQHKKACALALAMCSGRRKAELCRFRVDDFKSENLVCGGALYKTSEPIQTKGFGLGKFIYCYTLAKKFQPFFDVWMNQRKELGIESEWLFPAAGSPNEQMGDTTLERHIANCYDYFPRTTEPEVEPPIEQESASLDKPKDSAAKKVWL